MPEMRVSEPVVLLLNESLKAVREDIASMREEIREDRIRHAEEMRERDARHAEEMRKMKAQFSAETEKLRENLNVFNTLASKATGAWIFAGFILVSISYVTGLWDKFVKILP